MLAPAVAEPIEEKREVLAPCSFSPTKRRQPALEKQPSTSGYADALGVSASRGRRRSRRDVPVSNEQIIRKAYERAEKVDVKGWVECFTSDGTFTDMSIGVTYRGPDGPTGLGKTVEAYAQAFPDMHRDLYRFFNAGDVVVVELALQGTH